MNETLKEALTYKVQQFLKQPEGEFLLDSIEPIIEKTMMQTTIKTGTLQEHQNRAWSNYLEQVRAEAQWKLYKFIKYFGNENG